MPDKNPHAVVLGRLTSDRKTRAAQENGRKGGRPRKPKPEPPRVPDAADK